MNLEFTLNDQNEITKYINNYRNIHQVGPLEWNNEIALYSLEWSKVLNKLENIESSNSPFFGENIYKSKYDNEITLNLLKNAIDTWYNESVNYDYNTRMISSNTKEFTCLVWKSSTQYGMGISLNEHSKYIYIVFNTFTIGNISGQFTNNVFINTDNINTDNINTDNKNTDNITFKWVPPYPPWIWPLFPPFPKPYFKQKIVKNENKNNNNNNNNNILIKKIPLHCPKCVLCHKCMKCMMCAYNKKNKEIKSKCNILLKCELCTC